MDVNVYNYHKLHYLYFLSTFGNGHGDCKAHLRQEQTYSAQSYPLQTVIFICIIERKRSLMSSSKITPATKSLELTNDIVFKAVYGRDLEESKQTLIPLLNLLLRQIHILS